MKRNQQQTAFIHSRKGKSKKIVVDPANPIHPFIHKQRYRLREVFLHNQRIEIETELWKAHGNEFIFKEYEDDIYF
jgi:hypothetical protein